MNLDDEFLLEASEVVCVVVDWEDDEEQCLASGMSSFALRPVVHTKKSSKSSNTVCVRERECVCVCARYHGALSCERMMMLMCEQVSCTCVANKKNEMSKIRA